MELPQLSGGIDGNFRGIQAGDDSSPAIWHAQVNKSTNGG
jgi:hypothetical protein